MWRVDFVWVGRCERAATVSVNTASTGCVRVGVFLCVKAEGVFFCLNTHVFVFAYMHMQK